MYIALKNIILSGNTFLAGEEIPEEAVIPSRVTALMRSNHIVEKRNETSLNALTSFVENVANTIPVTIKRTNLGLFLKPDEASAILAILQMYTEEAIEAVQSLSEDALEVLREVESRKTIKKAAESRMKELETALPEESLESAVDPEGAEEDDV